MSARFTMLSGIAAHLPLPDVNTDTIIRVARGGKYSRGEFGPWALEPLRYRSDGSENPDFVLNDPRFRHAPILIAGENFGCGSSRETAVWALWDYGIRVIIAPSFGEIFYGNCFQNGLLPIRLPLPAVERLATQATGGTFTVDLERQLIVPPDAQSVAFEIDPLRREALLAGLDPIDVTLTRSAEIDAFEERDQGRRPWFHP
jgi:3-isopropylmalate/(R)-2-methylmalate dehydratase small subunit